MPIVVGHDPAAGLIGGTARAGAFQQALFEARRQAIQDAQVERRRQDALFEAQADRDFRATQAGLDRQFQAEQRAQSVQDRQTLMQAEADIGLERQKQLQNFTYTSSQQNERDRIQRSIQEVTQNPEYRDYEKAEIIRQLQGKLWDIKPTKPKMTAEQLQDEFDSTTIEDQNGLRWYKTSDGQWKAQHPPKDVDVSKLYADAMKALTTERYDDATGNTIKTPPSPEEVEKYVEGFIRLQERIKGRAKGGASQIDPIPGTGEPIVEEPPAGRPAAAGPMFARARPNPNAEPIPEWALRNPPGLEQASEPPPAQGSPPPAEQWAEIERQNSLARLEAIKQGATREDLDALDRQYSLVKRAMVDGKDPRPILNAMAAGELRQAVVDASSPERSAQASMMKSGRRSLETFLQAAGDIPQTRALFPILFEEGKSLSDPEAARQWAALPPDAKRRVAVALKVAGLLDRMR